MSNLRLKIKPQKRASARLCTLRERAGGQLHETKKKRTRRCASSIASRSRSFGSAGVSSWPQTAMTQQLLWNVCLLNISPVSIPLL